MGWGQNRTQKRHDLLGDLTHSFFYLLRNDIGLAGLVNHQGFLLPEFFFFFFFLPFFFIATPRGCSEIWPGSGEPPTPHVVLGNKPNSAPSKARLVCSRPLSKGLERVGFFCLLFSFFLFLWGAHTQD